MSALSMADEPDQESKRVQLQCYPKDPEAYRILEEIGGGASAKVHKASCVHSQGKSSLVAIKIFDLELEQSPADLDSPRRERTTMSLHSHPNVLSSHCSFVVDHYLWMVMPYMAGGSLQSIVSSCFPEGLPEPCISIVLNETLKGLYYLHDRGHLHTDIKAGNILVDTDNSSIILADYGKSVSIYDSSNIVGSSSSSSSSIMRLTDVAGSPYWIAPEVIRDSDTGYSFKADIWSFGIVALELAHGRPPVTHLPPSKTLIMKIRKRFGFTDYDDEKHKKDFKNKNYSKEFTDMVASCLNHDPSKRPSVDQLSEYSFFKNCKELDFLFKEVFDGLPNVEERFKEAKALHDGTWSSLQITAGTDIEEEGTNSVGPSVNSIRIGGWKFNEDEFVLDPVFHTESEDDEVVRMVRFGGETFIPDTNIDSSGGLGELEGLVGDHTGANMSRIQGICYRFDRKKMLEGLVALKRSTEEQKRAVVNMIVQLGGEADREEQMVQRIENLTEELEIEKEKNLKLKIELETINTVISGANNDASIAGNIFDDID
ncbi:unnamed protein product [Dovyalis caffra]|uniref:Protein kinase domain-containing protein n=1 Tax=Dovyalis caffra TaxID=77055 RepID=A0AAV1R518_9ROSI|nr:unnamed protein product [Dovyalis caffra]